MHCLQRCSMRLVVGKCCMSGMVAIVYLCAGSVALGPARLRSDFARLHTP